MSGYPGASKAKLPWQFDALPRGRSNFAPWAGLPGQAKLLYLDWLDMSDGGQGTLATRTEAELGRLLDRSDLAADLAALVQAGFVKATAGGRFFVRRPVDAFPRRLDPEDGGPPAMGCPAPALACAHESQSQNETEKKRQSIGEGKMGEGDRGAGRKGEPTGVDALLAEIEAAVTAKQERDRRTVAPETPIPRW